MAIGNNAFTALYPQHATIRILIFAMNFVSTIFIAALLFTVSLSERIHRHPVFVNLLATLALYSSMGTFAGVAEFSWKTAKQDIMNTYNYNQTDIVGLQMAEDMSDTVFDLFQTTLQDILWMITQVATLNLILYVWYTMKSTVRADSRRSEKRRTAVLVMSPYLFGAIPMIELIPSASIYGDIAISLVEVILILLTSAFDIVLLVSFWRRRRMMKRINVPDVTSSTVLIKLLIFSLYGVILSAILLAAGTAGSPILISISLIAQSFSPMLAFILLGLGHDTLEVWFPFAISNSDDKYIQMSESSSQNETFRHIHHQENPFIPSAPPPSDF